MTDADSTTSLLMSLTVLAPNDSTAVSAYEVLGRAAVAVALEGLQVSTSITTVTEVEDEEAT